MKKSNIFVVLAISTILLIPLSNVARAQPPSYVGVNEGDVYTWKVDLDVDGLDEVMNNIGTLLNDIDGYISTLDLGGYEDLTIPETLENISSTILSKVLPSGWESLNITELLEAFIHEFIPEANSTMFSWKIPGDWESLNISTFMGYVVDGLNNTLPAGWEDDPVPDLIKLAVSHFNDSLLFGIVPDGWEGLTIRGMINQILLEQAPKAHESFMLHMMLNEMLKNALPSGMEVLSMEELLSSVMPSDGSPINMSYILDTINYGTPPQFASLNMSDFIHELTLNISGMLPPQYMGIDTSTMLSGLIDQLMVNVSMMLVPSVFPTGFEFLSIQELADYLITQAKSSWNTAVLPGWTAQKAFLVAIPSLGFRVEITHIGPEEEAYPGGPSGVPIEMTFFISLDMNNWTELGDLFGDTTEGLMMALPAVPGDTTWTNMLMSNFTAYYSSYIVDPSSFSAQHRALAEQGLLTGGLFVANNYDWQTINTSFTIPIGVNPNGFEVSSEWNSNGVLTRLSLDANGINAVTISLFGAEEEIPGYEVAIILALAPITVLGLIYYMKKKNRIR
ncbi:MAG: hypothetical protein ACXABO_04205 [Promethearchaeota archaeon]|jgi:hypothetical protein